MLASMIGNIIESSSGTECVYGCALQKLTSAYIHPLFIVFFGAFWVIGSKISKLSSLAKEREKIINLNYRKSKKEFKWPWEHKLELVEDKENS